MALDVVNASSQYAQIDTTFSIAPPFSMGCWFNIDLMYLAHTLMFLGDSASINEWYALQAWTSIGGQPLRISRRAGPEDSCDTTTSISGSRWHHGLAVMTAVDDAAVLLDGGGKGTTTSSKEPTPLSRFAVGYQGDSSPGMYADGRIFWPALWNAALTDGEARLLALGVPPILIRPQNLVAFWPLVDNGRDWYGRYNLTLYNKPGWGVGPPVTYQHGRRLWTLPQPASSLAKPAGTLAA